MESMGLAKSRQTMLQNHGDESPTGRTTHKRSERHEAYNKTFGEDPDAVSSRVQQKHEVDKSKNSFMSWVFRVFFALVLVLVVGSLFWQSSTTRGQATSFLDGPQEEEPMIMMSRPATTGQ